LGVAVTSVTRECALMPGWDINAVKAEWRDMWHSSGRLRLHAPDKTFLGWLEKRRA
jgi:hypothetical protein